MAPSLSLFIRAPVSKHPYSPTKSKCGKERATLSLKAEKETNALFDMKFKVLTSVNFRAGYAIAAAKQRTQGYNRAPLFNFYFTKERRLK